MITHANSLNYNAMKNHYLITQIADILMQLYENGKAENASDHKPEYLRLSQAERERKERMGADA